MMNELVFAAVADDDTGASDLAGMLAEQGLRTLLVIDLPTAEQFAEWSADHHAIVMAEGTRNLAPAEASARTIAAIRALQTRRPRVLQIKYCSTFDSTPEGNIGTTIDAAMDETGEDFTIALPALPVNGRTTYQGYHFVNNRLLSDSPMRDHPLTPMTNPDLVALLGRQTRRRVGLAAYGEVEAGAERLRRCFHDLRAAGTNVALADCLNDAHLETICRAAADLPLITGSSAFGIKMPPIWRERGWITEARAGDDVPAPDVPATDAGHRACLIVAGSCSAATGEQNEWLREQGAPVIRVAPAQLLNNGAERRGIAQQIDAELRAGRHCLLTSTAAPAEMRAAQEWGARNGLSIPALGHAISSALAGLALEVMESSSVGGIIVAGGETSGAICRRLELGALRVGRNIEPGVPLCYSRGRFRLPVVLKSGNFGSRDFYGRAIRATSDAASYLS